MNDSNDRTPRLTDVDAARMFLEKVGVTPADLMRPSTGRHEIPAFADYIPRISGAVGSGTRRVYGLFEVNRGAVFV